MPLAAPFVTFYDVSTSERVELSGTTFENWVAKTANFLRDEFDLEPGSRVGVRLPVHWQTSVWIGAIWRVGATLVAQSNSGDSDNRDTLDLAVIGPAGVGAATDYPDPDTDTVACSLRPLNAPFADPLPAAMIDYSAEVLAHGDHFGPAEKMLPGQPALVMGDRSWTSAEVSADAAELRDRWGLAHGGRLLLPDRGTPDLSLPVWLSLLAVPLAAQGSLVIVRHPDPGTLDAIAEQERTSARLPATCWRE
ncbi:MAG: TIGR03089 family protein [Actinomycetes bacterium]